MLADKVKELIVKKSTNEQIYLALLPQGYSVSDIDKELKKYSSVSIAESGSSATESSVKAQIPEIHKENLLNIVITVLVIVFMGIGFSALIAANWSWLNSVAKLIIFISIMLLSYLVAFIYWENKGEQTLVSTIFFGVGVVVYGLILQLTGQIFNLPVSWQGGLILWFAGSLVLSCVLFNRILQYMSLLILVVTWFAYPFILFDSLVSQAYVWQSELYLFFLGLAIIAVVYGQFKTQQAKPITII